MTEEYKLELSARWHAVNRELEEVENLRVIPASDPAAR